MRLTLAGATPCGGPDRLRELRRRRALVGRAEGCIVAVSASGFEKSLDIGVDSKVYGSIMNTNKMTVSQLAARADVSADTVRYYERCGLLAPLMRSAAGYRLYDEDAVLRLSMIVGARQLGFSIAVLRELSGMLDRGICPCGHTESAIASMLADLEERIRRLVGLRAELASLKDKVTAESCPSQDVASWPCEHELANRVKAARQEGRNLQRRGAYGLLDTGPSGQPRPRPKHTTKQGS